MKLSKDFIQHTSAEEVVLVPIGSSKFYGIVRGNKTLGAILELLADDITEAQIIETMEKRFDAPKEVIIRDVKKAIDKLRGVGAIIE